MKKRAMITGISGQDGSYLGDLLLKKGYDVLGVVRRNATGDLGNAKHLEGLIEIEEGDVTDMASMMHLISSFKPDLIFNMAAMSHVQTSFDQPLYTLDVNTKGVVNILEAVRLTNPKIKVFTASTSEMFGNAPAPQTIDSFFIPQSPYAIAKIASHYFVRLYREAHGLFCVSGMTFNHECLYYNSPVILEKNGMIDICYVGSLVPNRTNYKKDTPRLTKDYDNDNIKIWDGKEFVKLKAVSRKKLKTLNVENRKRQVTNTPHGIVNTTPNHNLCNLSLEKVPANLIKQGDKLAHGVLPGSFGKMNSLTEDMAKFYGMICSDGYVNASVGRIEFTNNNSDVQREFSNLVNKCFCFTGISKWSHVSGFGGVSTHLRVTGISKEECKVLRNKIYDFRTKNKKVPSEVLNAPNNIKKAFIEGYYLGDGQKTGNGDYEYKSFKTNSPLLAQGLLYLFKQVSPEQDYCVCAFEQNGKVYTHINLNSPNKERENWGNSFKKERNTVSKIINIDEDNQHVFDVETESGRVCAGIGKMIIGNSPRRGPKFLTRKVTLGVAECLKNPEYKLQLGNLAPHRDWGWAPEYVAGFLKAMEQEEARDYIFATGETHSVKEFCEEAFSVVGLNWADFVVYEKKYDRPAEVNELRGDIQDTKHSLGWEAKIRFKEIVKRMVEFDCYGKEIID